MQDQSSPKCFNHPETDATSICHFCQRHICHDCLAESNNYMRCKDDFDCLNYQAKEGKYKPKTEQAKEENHDRCLGLTKYRQEPEPTYKNYKDDSELHEDFLESLLSNAVRSILTLSMTLGILGGLLGSVVLAAYEVYFWLKHGVWIGLTVQDLLITLGLLDPSNAGQGLIGGWLGISKIVYYALEMSAIIGSLLFSMIVLGIGELLNELWDEEKV